MHGSHHVAVVTGGGRGIGLACARRLAEGGAAVALLDVNELQVEDAAAGLRKAGHIAVGVVVDVTSEAQVEEAVTSVFAELGSPTILLNSAGILRATRFLDITEREWVEVVDVSLKGSFLCAKACLPSMIEHGWGRVINFSSTAGKSVSTLGGAHYTAAKAAVLGLTRALAKESAEHGICVNAICPGLIDTEMARETCGEDRLGAYAASFPIRRLGQPDEVAALVAFLCSQEADYITGAAFDINGGDLMV